MANRFAPYKERFLAREPRCLVLKISAANANTSTNQTLAAEPYNMGVYRIATTATNGEYKIYLGSSSTSRDHYAGFAGMTLCTTQADGGCFEITNYECNHATDPNVSFQLVKNSDDINTELADSGVAFIRLYMLDSKD